MSIATALRNYRVAAWVTGVGLLVLVFIAMPLKYFFGEPRPVALVGMLHGFLYMAYIVCTLILAERCRWRPLDAVAILLAGTIPIASFVAERQVRAGSARAGRCWARAHPPARERALRLRSVFLLRAAQRAPYESVRLPLPQLLRCRGPAGEGQAHVVVALRGLHTQAQPAAVDAQRAHPRTLAMAQLRGQVPGERDEHLGVRLLEGGPASGPPCRQNGSGRAAARSTGVSAAQPSPSVSTAEPGSRRTQRGTVAELE